jgi:nucleoid DNA-binding protein
MRLRSGKARKKYGRGMSRKQYVIISAVILVTILGFSVISYFYTDLNPLVMMSTHEVQVYRPNGEGYVYISSDYYLAKQTGEKHNVVVFNYGYEVFRFEIGRRIDVIAVEKEGSIYKFDYWQIWESYSKYTKIYDKQVSLLMDKDYAVKVVFSIAPEARPPKPSPTTPEPYMPKTGEPLILYMSPVGAGVVKLTRPTLGEDIVGASGMTYRYELGRTVRLWATPNVGYRFHSWFIQRGSNSYLEPANPLTIRMDGGYMIQARFEASGYKPKTTTTTTTTKTTTTQNLPILISFCVEGEGGFWNFADQLEQYKLGSGRFVRNKCTDGALPSYSYSGGTKVSLVAEPDAGWKFVRYEGVVSSTNPKTNFEIKQSMRLGHVKCVFERIPTALYEGDIIALNRLGVASSFRVTEFDGKTSQSVETGKNTLVQFRYVIKNIHHSKAEFSVMLQTFSEDGHVGDRIYEPHIGSSSGDGSRAWRTLNAGQEETFVHEILVGGNHATVKVSIYARVNGMIFEKKLPLFGVAVR